MGGQGHQALNEEEEPPSSTRYSLHPSRSQTVVQEKDPLPDESCGDTEVQRREERDAQGHS